MDFVEQLSALAERIPGQVEHIQTEEATKHAFVMPFIAALGYNVFDPREVVPELTADVGTKKGEKVDYAVMKDGRPIMLFECKWSGRSLDEAHASQLFRYFTVTPARIGVLTNGLQYRFFSDLEERNKMDSRPFLVVDMLDLKREVVPELRKLTRDEFDVDAVIAAAEDMKYMGAIKQVLAAQLREPHEDFVRFLIAQAHGGRVTPTLRTQFADYARRALAQLVSERVSARLQSALEEEARAHTASPAPSLGADAPPVVPPGDAIVAADVDSENRVHTTEEELEAFWLVKSILRESVDPSRIVHRDTISYFGVLLDDNNRKPICRLHFNRARKFIGLFDDEKRETRHPIDKLDDIFRFAVELRASVQRYDAARASPVAVES